MPVRIIEDVSDYVVFYNLNNQYEDSMDSVDLLFEKGMLKTTKSNDCKFLFPIFRHEAIAVRLIVYALMDYKELFGNEFKTYQFVDWVSKGKLYKNYLILVWITKKHKEMKKNEYYFNQTCKKPIEANKQIQESNLKDFNVFDEVDIGEYKRSTLKHYTLNKHKIKKIIYLLSNSVFLDVFDKISGTETSVINYGELKDTTRTYEVIHLNKSFTKVERKFKYDNWLF